MRRRNHWAMDDDGSAALEFITVGVILLVPIVYLVIALGAIQEQTLGVEAAARHTARVIALAPDADAAAVRAEQVLSAVTAEYGVDEDSLEVSTSCMPTGADCPSAGAVITIVITAQVRLPLIPPIFGLDEAASITVEGTAVQKVSRLWGG